MNIVLNEQGALCYFDGTALVPLALAGGAPLTVSGTIAAGQVLTINMATGWSYGSVQWRRNTNGTVANIVGAIGNTYTQVSADIGANISVFPVASGLVYSASSIAIPAQTQTLAISGVPATGATVGVTYSFTPNTIGGTTPRTFALSGTLPSGLTFNASTGAIAGTPTAAVTASNLTISVTDAVGGSAALAPFSLTVVAAAVALAISGSPSTSATIGSPYSFTPTAVGGTAPRTFALIAGTLPPGLSFSTSTGAITGTATAAYVASGLSIRVTDAVNATATLPTFTLTSAAAPVTGLTLTGAPVTTANAGAAYAGFTVVASNGTVPYTYSIVGGPSGMVVNSAGLVTYPAPVANTYANIVIRVTDAGGAVANLAAFSLVVSSGASAPVNTNIPLIVGTAQQSYTLTLNDGTWTGATSLAHQLLRNGTPIPSTAGSTYVLQAADVGANLVLRVTATGSTGTTTVMDSEATLTVLPAATLSGAPYPLTAFAVPGYANLTMPYELLPAIAGGIGPRQVTLNGTLPAGLTLVDSTTGLVTGTPTAIGTSGSLTYTITDSTGSITTAAFSIIVGAAPTVIPASGDTTGTTDSAAIEAQLSTGKSVSLAAGVIIKQSIKMRTNTACYLAAGNTALFLAAGSNCPMFVNANGSSRTRIDQNITIAGTGTSKLDGNGINQASQSSTYHPSSAYMVSVRNIVMRGFVSAPRAQNVLAIGCKLVSLRNVQFAATPGPNTDGFDVGPGCEDIHGEDIRGVVADDVFSGFAKAAQAGGNFSSGTSWSTGANCANMIFKDVYIGSSAQNVIRLQADANFSFTNFYASNVHNILSSNPNVLCLLGNSIYIDAPPTDGEQLKNITLEDSGMGCKILLQTDIRASNVYLKNMYASAPQDNTMLVQSQVDDLTLDGLYHASNSTVTHGPIFGSSNRTFAGLTIKNVVMPQVSSIMTSNSGGSVTLENIRLGAGSNLFPTTGAWTGTMKNVTVLNTPVAAFSGVTIVANAAVANDAALAPYKAARQAAMTSTREWHLNMLLTRLRADGILTALDRLLLLCDESSLSDGLVNVVNPSATKPTPVGGTFVAGVGFAMNGTSDYLALGETWQARGKFALNSATLGVWVNLQVGTGSFVLAGSETSPEVRVFGRSNGAASWRLNGAADISGPTMTSRARHHTVTRTSASESRRVFNGLDVQKTTTDTAVALPTGTGAFGRHLTSYSPDRFCLVYTGSGLTGPQALKLRSALATFTAAVGAQ